MSKSRSRSRSRATTPPLKSRSKSASLERDQRQKSKSRDRSESKDDKNSRTLLKVTGLLFHIQVKATIRYFTPKQLLLVAVTGFAVLKFTEPLANFISHIFFFVYYISCCWCNHPCLPKEQNERSSPTPEEETTLLLSSQD